MTVLRIRQVSGLSRLECMIKINMAKFLGFNNCDRFSQVTADTGSTVRVCICTYVPLQLSTKITQCKLQVDVGLG